MPISGVKQPEIIQIDEELRLRKYSKDNSFALPWYRDAETLMLVNGKKEYRNKGIGKKVVTELIKRGKELGYASLFVDEVYNYNVGSRNLFEGAGFKRYEVTTLGYRFRYDFNK